MEVIQEKIKTKAYHFHIQTKGGTIIYRGESMFPTLQDSWRIRIKPEDSKKIEVGDIIVFSFDNNLMVHRVIGRLKKGEELFFIQKGDATYFGKIFGGIITADDIVGKVIEVVDPPLGKIDNRPWKKQNTILIIHSFIICFIYTFLSYLKRKVWGKRTNYITSWLYHIYWKFSLLILNIIGAKHRFSKSSCPTENLT